MFTLRASRTLPLALLSVLLGGCINGNYMDASEPDAAKLRFVANTPNTTLDYFDDTHCEGQTTGTLNNIFTRDSERKVGMSFAPPADADGYLELKLKPEQEAYFRIHMRTGYVLCGISFNLTPERNAEYELTLNSGKGSCKTLLQRVRHINGQLVRTPIPVENKGLPACAGTSPIFPKLFPDTPHRVALIDQIIDKDTLIPREPDPSRSERLKWSPEKVDTLIAERKAKLGFTLPDAYWALYRQNLETFNAEALGNEAQVLQRYKDEYRQRLKQRDDRQLEQWAVPADKTSKEIDAARLLESRAMAMYYFQVQKTVLATTLSQHLDRMAQMDAQYDVCKRYAECWKLSER
ncbi:hypothetical protein [Pseudomonas sp. NPDC089734]|uniref:hypothetical protein n=1 Tax=Pseudomonas sp. NPDC089734 TaxID=3364469 RepID=UPI0037F9F29F